MLFRSHQKRALLVELDGEGDVTVEKITLPRLRDLRTVKGTMEQLLAPTGGGFASDDYVQITVLTQGTEVAASRQLRNVYPNYLQIRYQSPVTQALELGGHGELSRLTLSGAYQRFYRQVTGHDLAPEALELLERLSRQAEQEREEETG